MKTFADIDVNVLRAFAEVLKPKCPEAVIHTPDDLAGDDARIKLAFKAGRASVLTDIEAAIRMKQGRT